MPHFWYTANNYLLAEEVRAVRVLHMEVAEIDDLSIINVKPQSRGSDARGEQAAVALNSPVGDAMWACCDLKYVYATLF
jgi:hypothetical protein